MYAMEIESKKVWDFSKESYVNRLVHNEVDGKMVEVLDEGSQIDSEGHCNKSVDSMFSFNKKIESLNHQYNIILVKTLEDQRQFFEEELNKIEQERLYPLNQKRK